MSSRLNFDFRSLISDENLSFEIQFLIKRLAESYGDYSGSYGFLRLEEEYWFRAVFFVPVFFRPFNF